jgi:hypothetical protein
MRREFVYNLETDESGLYTARVLSQKEKKLIQDKYRRMYNKEIEDGIYTLYYIDNPYNGGYIEIRTDDYIVKYAIKGGKR